MGKAKRQEFNSVNHCVTKTKTALPLIVLSFSGDVTLRLDGNQNIESHTESMTIGDFYDHHRRLGHFQILLKHAKMVKGNVLPIELAIDLLGVRSVLLPSAIA